MFCFLGAAIAPAPTVFGIAASGNTEAMSQVMQAQAGLVKGKLCKICFHKMQFIPTCLVWSDFGPLKQKQTGFSAKV